jgi:hypothetical protein
VTSMHSRGGVEALTEVWAHSDTGGCDHHPSKDAHGRPPAAVVPTYLIAGPPVWGLAAPGAEPTPALGAPRRRVCVHVYAEAVLMSLSMT